MKINPQIDLQIATDFSPLPKRTLFKTWVIQALSGGLEPKNSPACARPALTIRLVDADEIHELNLHYRGKDKPTNVLSFPFEAPDGLPLKTFLLGDIVICPSILLEESTAQHKKYLDHFAHMVIHGVLHLLGYDHEIETEAEQMETLEIQLLQGLNIQNPYQGDLA